MFLEIIEQFELAWGSEYEHKHIARVVGTDRSQVSEGEGRSWHEALGMLLAQNHALFGVVDIRQVPLEKRMGAGEEGLHPDARTTIRRAADTVRRAQQTQKGNEKAA